MDSTSILCFSQTEVHEDFHISCTAGQNFSCIHLLDDCVCVYLLSLGISVICDFFFSDFFKIVFLSLMVYERKDGFLTVQLKVDANFQQSSEFVIKILFVCLFVCRPGCDGGELSQLVVCEIALMKTCCFFQLREDESIQMGLVLSALSCEA